MSDEEINNFIISHSWLLNEKYLDEEVLNDFLKSHFISLKDRYNTLYNEVCKYEK